MYRIALRAAPTREANAPHETGQYQGPLVLAAPVNFEDTNMANADPTADSHHVVQTGASVVLLDDAFEGLIDDDLDMLEGVQKIIDAPLALDALGDAVTELGSMSRTAAEGCARLSP